MRNKLLFLICVFFMMMCMCGTAFAEIYQEGDYIVVPGSGNSNLPLYLNIPDNTNWGLYRIDDSNPNYYCDLYVIADKNITTIPGYVWPSSSGNYNTQYGFICQSSSIDGLEQFEYYPGITYSELKTGLANGSIPWNMGVVSGTNMNEPVYDPTIPAPQNLTFSRRSEGGFLGIGSTEYFVMNWSNPADSTLKCRIDGDVSGMPMVGGVSVQKFIRFVDQSSTPPLDADSSKYEFTVDQVEDLLEGNMQRLDYLRLQFYRETETGISVGPISTITLKLGLFGKYTYEVSTQYPVNETDPGSDGGLDDSYLDKWSNTGQPVIEYDQDSNVVGSSTGSASPTQIANSILSYIQTFFSFFGRLLSMIQDLSSQAGAFAALFAKLFIFLPPEVTAILSASILGAAALRLFGR